MPQVLAASSSIASCPSVLTRDAKRRPILQRRLIAVNRGKDHVVEPFQMVTTSGRDFSAAHGDRFQRGMRGRGHGMSSRLKRVTHVVKAWMNHRRNACPNKRFVPRLEFYR